MTDELKKEIEELKDLINILQKTMEEDEDIKEEVCRDLNEKHQKKLDDLYNQILNIMTRTYFLNQYAERDFKEEIDKLFINVRGEEKK